MINRLKTYTFDNSIMTRLNLHTCDNSMITRIQLTLIHADGHNLTYVLIEYVLRFKSPTNQKALQQDDENQIVKLRRHKPHATQDDDKNTLHKMTIKIGKKEVKI